MQTPKLETTRFHLGILQIIINIINNIKNLNIDKKIIDLNNIDKIVEKIIQYIEVK